MAARVDDPGILVGLLDHAPVTVMLIGPTGEVRWVNDAGATMFGYDPDEVIGTNILEYLDPEWDPVAFESIGAAMAARGARLPMVFRVIRRDGTKVICEVTANAQLHDPVLEGLVCYVRRWDERHLLDRALETLAAGAPLGSTLPLLVEVAASETLGADAAIVLDPDATGRRGTTFAGPALDPLLAGPAATGGAEAGGEPTRTGAPGEAPWSTVARTGAPLFVPVDALDDPWRATAVAAGYRALWAWPVPGRPAPTRAALLLWRRDPQVEPDHTRVLFAEQLARLVDLVADRADSEARLHHAAHHDPLTGLANRARFWERLATYLDPGSGRGPVVGVAYVDLDRFKPLNDQFGHGAGDDVLAHIGERLRRTVRTGDVVARLGGDEFAVLCPDLGDLDELRALADRIVAGAAEPISVDGTAIRVGASVGIAAARPGETDPDALVEAADDALLSAKAAGRGIWREGAVLGITADQG